MIGKRGAGAQHEMIDEAGGETDDQWHHGVRRIGETLVVRDRWQGLLGPNAWLTVPLMLVGGFSAWDSVTRRVCDPSDRRVFDLGGSEVSMPTCDSMVTRLRGLHELHMASVWTTIACTLALAFVALRCYPVVSFGPQNVRWRNWFRWKETSTNQIAGLDVMNYNQRAWVPAVAVVLQPSASGGRRPRFIATLAYRKNVAATIAEAINCWADEHDISSDLQPETMVWRMSEPE